MPHAPSTSAPAPLTLRHDAAHRRFLAQTNEGTGLLEYEMPDAQTLDFYHTYVPPALRGRGIASLVVRYALDHARAQGLGVIPSCSFVAGYLDDHPEYADLRRA